MKIVYSIVLQRNISDFIYMNVYDDSYCKQITSD